MDLSPLSPEIRKAFGFTEADVVRTLRPGSALDTTKATLTCRACGQATTATLREFWLADAKCVCGTTYPAADFLSSPIQQNPPD